MIQSHFTKLMLASLLAIAGISSYAQDKFPKPDSCILMKAEKGKDLLKDCSGSRYQQLVDSLWTPTQQEFEDLLANFYKKSQQVKDDYAYVIQYVGVSIKGEKFIYINAFPKYQLSQIVKVHGDLQYAPVVACGGGKLYWRALYNKTKAFDSVQTNAAM